MTGRVALCPDAPLLFRELCGADDAVPDLRVACREAVAWLLADGPEEVWVIGSADEPGTHDPGERPDVRRFGTTGERTPPGKGLPLSLGVGRRLLDEAGWNGPTTLVGVRPDAAAGELDDLADDLGSDLAGRSSATAVLLLGDGSARRGQTAPGFLDERAFAFDDAVADALAEGDALALRDLDEALARDLMVGGRPVLRLLGRVADRVGGPAQAELAYRDDPFGVSYFVARWVLG